MSEIFARIQARDAAGVRAILAADPGAASARERVLGSTPLHFAAHRGCEPIVDDLLAHGADVRAIEQASGTTPLHWAAEGGHAAIAATLLARGAPLEAADEWFALAPLGWATAVTWNPGFHRDRGATAELLVRAGAEVGIFAAVARGQADEVRAALARRPEAVRERLGFVGWGLTPLHLAVDRGAAELVALLLDAGADPGARSDLGQTPLGHALAAGDAAGAAALREAGARDDAASALAAGDLAALELRLAGTPRETLDRLLFGAARAAQPRAVELLLRAGADPDATLRHLLGETPAPVAALHEAARRGSVAAARALLDAGAAPSPGAAEGWATPLHLAAGAGYAELAMLLCERGADRAARDREYGATPAGWAEYAGHADLARRLGAVGAG